MIMRCPFLTEVTWKNQNYTRKNFSEECKDFFCELELEFRFFSSSRKLKEKGFEQFCLHPKNQKNNYYEKICLHLAEIKGNMYRKSSIRSRPCIILNPKFPRLVLEVFQKL